MMVAPCHPPDEHDACGLVAFVQRHGVATRDIIEDTLRALRDMEHRSGLVDGEGDGCGILVDLPKLLWQRRLLAAGQPSDIATDPSFFVIHSFISPSAGESLATIREHACGNLMAYGLHVLAEAINEVDSDALGPRARAEEPVFWQLAGVAPNWTADETNAALFRWCEQVERELPLSVLSASADSVVYKVRGTPSVLYAYYRDLRDPLLVSTMAIGHNRYSTNTTSSCLRAQPFSLLAHNGEINTIKQCRAEMRALGLEPLDSASDSQDVNWLLAALIHRFQLSLLEALELLFPPIINEIKYMPPTLQDLYMYGRQLWGPFCQGPAAVLARYANTCVGSMDALGLRPLWLGGTADAYFFTSEKGVVPLENQVCDPKPLAPGEKAAIVLEPDGAHVLDYDAIQETVLTRARARGWPIDGFHRYLQPGVEIHGSRSTCQITESASDHQSSPVEVDERRYSSTITEERVELGLLVAHGWEQEDVATVKSAAETGKEEIGSLGFDGPLAALSPYQQNCADYFKEMVAVVTNPAIDREREIEHFSTRVYLGARPSFTKPSPPPEVGVELLLPVILGGHGASTRIPAYREIASEHGTVLLDDLLALFALCHRTVLMRQEEDESPVNALTRLGTQAVAAVKEGARLLILDDTEAFQTGYLPLDPLLAVAAVDEALRQETSSDGLRLRRSVGLLVRSGALRNLHDIAMAIGLGADSVNPYLMLHLAYEHAGLEGVGRLCTMLRCGLEKVISTLGIHELRGYGRLFASIGLRPEVAQVFGTANFGGSENAGLGWSELWEDARRRARIAHGKGETRLPKVMHFYPKIWKAAGDVAQGRIPYTVFAERVAELEREHPVSLRHVLALRSPDRPQSASAIDPERVDTTVGVNRYPLLICSMSFGSQGETAFRAYAEAAYRSNIVCINGEGGEIKDLMGRYRHNRGQQIASGRFGVGAELANASDLLEIKIGQGAKPGEGGHLPGKKVSPKVAAARNARPGVDLISPSNNHDIYSIEDLAQVIEVLKTVNPSARVSVKVPVVDGIGTIAVGIAKAGADIITLSGYDGGTGAARKHALRYAGLPAEIGVVAAHRALCEAGLRDRVEIWCDGGMKTAQDVMKMILLGANRVGFGTMAMVAIGCTVCRGCQLDTCHVGIATQIETQEEAIEKQLKRFVPRDFEEAVTRLCTFFDAIGAEVARLTAELGYTRTQDLVGRSDLLLQAAAHGQLDLSALLEPATTSAIATHSWQTLHREAVDRPAARVRALATHVVAGAGGGAPLQLDERASPTDRVLGADLAGALTRIRIATQQHLTSMANDSVLAQLHFNSSSVPGNGLAAFNVDGLAIAVTGGGQDGIGMGALGGEIAILKGVNRLGQRLDGSVGKGLAYGAQRGTFYVQGDADSRAGIRLSGARILIGGTPKKPVGMGANLASYANIKGFAFEYMTSGVGVVLGDPGPWLCSGMTGGTVYIRLQPELGLDAAAIERRLAKGARVVVLPAGEQDNSVLREMLGRYHELLQQSGQDEEARRVAALLDEPARHFLAIRPIGQQVDPDISTE
jgi:glutamate synthase (NADPH/NADH) large chain